MAPQTFVFHILNFDNCEGCRQKVRKAVGVDLVKIDLEKCHVTVSTSKRPEVVKNALRKKFKNRVVLLSPLNNSQNSLVINNEDNNVGVQGNRQEEINTEIIHGMSRQTRSSSNKRVKLDHTATSSTTVPNVVIEDNNGKIIITIKPQQRIELTVTNRQAVNPRPGRHETTNATRRLKSYHRHDLVLENKLPSYNCSGCKELGFGERYECKTCTYFLHPDCMYYQETATHEFLDRSIFKFCKKSFDSNTRYCNACGMNILGFFYHCEKTDKDLHPCCLNLKKTVTIDDESFRLCRVLPSECWCCNLKKKKKKDNRDTCWCYSSENQDCHFHVYCMKEQLVKCLNGGRNGVMVLGTRKKKAFEALKWAGKFLDVVFSLLTTGIPAPIFSVALELLGQ